MARKLVALFVLPAFSLFSLSCFPVKTIRTGEIDPSQIAGVSKPLQVMSVVTKEGKSWEFSKDQPGAYLPGGDAVKGMALQSFDIDKTEVKSFLPAKDKRSGTLFTNDGRTIQVVRSKEEGGRFFFSAYASVAIPISDIQQIWVKKTNPGALLINGVIWASVLTAAGYGIIALTVHEIADDFGSCPFVYSYNGEEFVLDAEPYGSAFTEGLKRTDWVELSNLRSVDGRYRVMLTNELDETQYTDELKLLAVDHAPGARIAPDSEGRIHVFDRPQAPSRAVDGRDRDILAFVVGNDRAFWLSPLDEKVTDGENGNEGDFRDELVLEFPKPAGAKTARVLANVWTTQWASLTAGKIVGLYGTALEEAYRDVDRGGPSQAILKGWMAREELNQLKLWVETPDGWKVRGTIFGGSPVVTKDKACTLDVADVPGEVLRIKLRPPVNFWAVNSLAVDYGENTPVRITELAAEKAVLQSGRDVRAALAATDAAYLESPVHGEWTEAAFAAPPLEAGQERTVLVKASGYYRINVDQTDEPQTELLGRLLREPGFVARYSFNEYLKWEAGLRAAAKK